MKKLYLILSLVLFSFIANASITGESQARCPNYSYLYKCNYQNDDLYEWVWTIKGGTIISGMNDSDAWVSWNDSNEEHYVRVRTYRIAYDNDGNKTLHEIGNSKKIVRVMSLKDVLPAGFTKGDFSINPGDNTPVTYTIPLLYYPECYENIEKPVNDYEWIIPAGWEYNGTISDGTTPIKTHNISITVIPDNCTGGKIKVRGVPECTGQSKSEYRSKTIIRSDNNIVSSISTTVCGKPKEITLNIGSVPNATYQWTKPASWTWTSGTNSNVVKVMPDGLSGGTISVIVNGCTSLKESKTITLYNWDPNEPDPSLSGSNMVCSSGSIYNLNNLPSGTSVTWTSSPTINFPNGNVGETVTAKQVGFSGTGWIEATINSACGEVTLPRKEVWVGSPLKPYDISFYPNEPCLNQIAYAIVRANNPPESQVHYNWRNYHIYVDQNSTGSEVHFQTKTRIHYTTYVRVKGTNECGSSQEYSKLLRVKDCGGGGIEPVPLSINSDPLIVSKVGLSEEGNSKQLADTQMNVGSAITSITIFPNPVEDIVNIQIPGNLIADNNCSIEIYNSTGKLLLKKKVTSTTNSIDLSNSPSGTYVVKLITDQEIITKKIIKK
ncbi:T9SS type A sorting domain-containing protein [Labilibaculum sp. A4]|uniref:T9SS type A sorting domain-containing protein n=1 Tax=Labilibaculum euxinus TaxID=2686357 RepID=UPI0013666D03|nr:T9SS type A sorting domain-containing protein [Labilibaculum euxinus]MDQ1769258.1 T9SS type A sorting domain-containing protein [Labilibaculum euxinus]MWN74782.1 T9SS type A sorting domain-containing protein [Labilibaculum euxinus]